MNSNNRPADMIYPDMSHFVLASNRHEPPDRHRPIDVGQDVQLLLDNHLLGVGRSYDQYPHNICWGPGEVRKHDQSLFGGFTPEDQGIAWAQVRREGDRYRLWYNASRDDRLVVAQAVSDDGVHFVTCETQVFDGGPDGVSLEFGNVFIDPKASADLRYRMVYTDWLYPQNPATPFSHAVGALRGAASANGSGWKRYYENFLGSYCDSQNVGGWDPRLERYVIYHRATCTYGAIAAGKNQVTSAERGRAIGRIESLDFVHWSPTRLALEPDAQDGLGVDVYNNAWSPHPRLPGIHLMFPSFYQHYDGTFDVQIAVSRDNLNWSRPTRRTFIPLGGEGEFDRFIISVCPGIVPIDDEHDALYYRGGNIPHGGSAPILSEEEIERRKPASRLGRVVVKRDRFLGIESQGAEEGQFCTRPLRVDGSYLHVNCEPIGHNAQLCIQIIDAETEQPASGFLFQDTIPVTTDALEARVRWKSHHCLSKDLIDRPIRLHIRMKNMRIFSFQFFDQ